MIDQRNQRRNADAEWCQRRRSERDGVRRKLQYAENLKFEKRFAQKKDPKGLYGGERMRTRDIKSTMPAALLIPNGTNSSGAVRPK